MSTPLLIRPEAAHGIQSIELEITGTCQLACSHCCTDSGPKQSQGSMTRGDWSTVIDDAHALGIPAVQFIGGEPTLHPHLVPLIDHALNRGLAVEVYSNLTHVRPSLWHAFARDGVRLATSYYSDVAEEHERITGGRGSYQRTRANIIEAVRLGIPLRAGIVEVLDGQRTAAAEAELRALGVEKIQIDRTRKVGRAAGDTTTLPSVTELCGRCFTRRAAIGPDGDVYGCILSRFMPAGNVRTRRLADIVHSDQWAQLMARVPAPGRACPPDDAGDCDPANTEACDPAY